MTPSQRDTVQALVNAVCQVPAVHRTAQMHSAVFAGRALLEQPQSTNDLHAAIMNLPGEADMYESGDYRTGYRIGHRDARHAAAELVAAQPPADGWVCVPSVVREAIEATFEQREGHLKLVAAAVRALGPVKAQSKADERMRHDYPLLAQFHTKHALGSLAAPSCLCCGQQTHPITRPIAVQHLELPAIVVCKPCKAAAPQPPAREPLTQEQIAGIVREASRGAAMRRDGTTSTRIVRAVEAAHGITGERR